MRAIFLAILCSLFLTLTASAQKESRTLSDKETKELMNQLKIDSTVFLRTASNSACQCIDSVHREKAAKQKEMDGIAFCIDKEVTVYQSLAKLFQALKTGNKKTEINISMNENDDEYKRYYYEIERWLKDSCVVLNKAITSQDDATDKSFSSNPEARSAYSKGVALLDKEEFEKAIPFFEKAVQTDAVFAFAWDNLGVCYRKTGNYQKAINAYKQSLKVDSSGHTPLQNLPIAYMYLKQYEEAIGAYNDILKYYPGDPEVYYGIGNIYTAHLNEYEKGLMNLCKAYNIYVEQKSPFRTDAEKLINFIYGQMKKENKEERFYQILKENNIKSN